MKYFIKKLSLLILLLPVRVFANLTPVAGTSIAEKLDQMNNFIHMLSLFFGLLIVGVFILFAFLYKRKHKDEEGSSQVHHHNLLEFTWSFIPFLIFMGMFGWGWYIYHQMRSFPKGALEIHVYGQMWNWDYVYKNGKKVTDALYVPVDRDVKIILKSRDVIHSFFIPAFRIKQDVLPNRYTALWFRANKQGQFNVFCTEYCGTGHYNMLSKVKVMSLINFEKWLATDPYEGLSIAEVGKKVFQGRCTACHSIGDRRMIGPGLKGLFGSSREFTDGSHLVADDNYIMESILNPSKKLVKGYASQMTPFAGLLQEEELAGLVEYIKTLK